jgi:hypothetical protein
MISDPKIIKVSTINDWRLTLLRIVKKAAWGLMRIIGMPIPAGSMKPYRIKASS